MCYNTGWGGRMSEEEFRQEINRLRNREIEELFVSREDFMDFRKVLVAEEDFKHFRGIALRGGHVRYIYLDEPEI